MNAEDRLRDAAYAIAATVREVTPLDLPADALPEAAGLDPATERGPKPLDVPGAPGRARRGRPGHRPRLPWAVPLAAAAAVVALAASLVAVRSIGPGRPPVSPSSPAPSSLVPVPISGAIPRYYVALNRLPSGAAGVGDTRSGQWVATVPLPPGSGRFAGVTGAGDDRTFVVDVAQASPPSTFSNFTPRSWYLLRIAPGTAHPAVLTRLPIPPTQDGTLVLGIALSPDGTRLAVLSQSLGMGGSSVTGPVTLRIYSAATGQALRTWTGPSQRTGPGETANSGDFDANTSLTWIAGGRTLAFSYTATTGNGGLTFRMLDLSRPGHDLFAGSKPVPAPRFATGCEDLPLVTADGRTAICGTSAFPTGGYGSCRVIGRGGIGGRPRFVEYSTVTGKLTRVLYQYPGSCTDGFASVYWASPSGDTLIGWLNVDSQFAKTNRIEAGLFTNGTFRPLQLHLAVPPNRLGTPSPGPYAL